MKSKGIILIISFMIVLSWRLECFSLDENTHTAINWHIAQETVNGFSFNDYLMTNLGFKDGAKDSLRGYDAEGKIQENKIYWWLGYGGEQEDRPGSTKDYVKYVLAGTPVRSNNHFHNPLCASKPFDTQYAWENAGLHDFVLFATPPFSVAGKSSILWGQSNQDPAGNLGGKWSWQNAREYFYIALTGKNFEGVGKASTQEDRADYFAKTFRALGQQMHLVQDTSVPAHVRNNLHLDPGYERYVEKKLRTGNTALWKSLLTSPVTFDKSILDKPTENNDAGVPVARIVDSDIYTGDNPDDTKTLGDPKAPLPQPIGIAEYAQVNFLSPGTIFTSDGGHNFPNPKTADLTMSQQDDNNKRFYYGKTGSGDKVDYLAVRGIVDAHRMAYFPQDNERKPVYLDDKCYEDYAKKLIPRAVGYSAGLLKYFFRGQINLVLPDPDNKPNEYEIKNDSEEDMDGIFEVFYDDQNNKRQSIVLNGGGMFSATIPKGGSVPVTFTAPTDFKEQGKYILVFRGLLGNEYNAVVGRVVTMWREEWDKDGDLHANHPWEFEGLDYTEHCDPTNISNEVSGSKLIKHSVAVHDNGLYYPGGNGASTVVGKSYKAPVDIRYPGTPEYASCTDKSEGVRYCFDSYCWYGCVPFDFGKEFPMPITKDTWLSLKIDEMSSTVPVCPVTLFGNQSTQGIVIRLVVGPNNSGVSFNFTFPGNEAETANYNKIVPQGSGYAVNLYALLGASLIKVEEPVMVSWININQYIACSPEASGSSYEQHMVVDYIRIMDR